MFIVDEFSTVACWKMDSDKKKKRKLKQKECKIRRIRMILLPEASEARSCEVRTKQIE